jgi:hypothetical protein
MPKASQHNILKRFALPLSLASALLGTAACGDKVKVTEGVVVEHQFTPPRDWIYLQPIPHTYCSRSDKTTICTTTFTYVPIPMHDPEKYELVLRDCEQRVENDACAVGAVAVDRATYEQYQNGQYYNSPQPQK